jgi:SAM-dependent methyltransferase
MNEAIREPRPRTKTEEWDWHGSYQWTYFVEGVKQRINYFLSERLKGKNIDVGGGWYLSYPNSTVVDLSPVCLEKNPAKEKLQFDLEDLTQGKKLPYKDHSFDSATLVSVWEYLNDPRSVMKEMERVVKPGGEVYIINGQGAGISEWKVNSGKSPDIKNFLDGMGYDTLIENIPTTDDNPKVFQSVCVAMPEADLYGKRISMIKNKTERMKKNAEIIDGPWIFTKEYQYEELKNIGERLLKLSHYPVTKYSKEFLNQIELSSQEYHRKTDDIPLIFKEHATPPEILMLTANDKHQSHSLVLMGKKQKANNYEDDNVLQKTDPNLMHYINYFEQSNIADLLRHCDDLGNKNYRTYHSSDYYRILEEKNREIDRLVRFISHLGLNTFTRDLQREIYKRLRPFTRDLDETIKKNQMYAYHLLTMEHKQKRTIDELIQRKEQIEKKNIPTIGTGKINILKTIKGLQEYIK